MLKKSLTDNIFAVATNKTDIHDKTGGMHPCSVLFNEMSMVAEGKCSK